MSNKSGATFEDFGTHVECSSGGLFRNPGYIVVLFLGPEFRVFHLANAPKARRVIEFATLIIPPNNVAAVKDRLSIFTASNWSYVEEDTILAYIENFLKVKNVTTPKS